MMRSFYLRSMALGACLLACGWCYGQLVTTPVFASDSLEQELTIREGMDAVPEAIELTYRNDGGAPLHAEVAKTSCGCVKGEVLTAEVAPGGEGRIEVDLREVKLKRDYAAYVLVKTDDPDQASVRFLVKLKLIKALDVKPGDELSLGLIPQGEARPVDFEVVQGLGDVPLEITVDAAQSDVAAEVQQIQKTPYGQYQIHVALDTNIAPGPFSRSLLVKTNWEDPKEIPLKVTGIIAADLVATPWQVTLPKMLSSNAVTRRVVVKSRVAGVTLKSAETTMPGLQVRTETKPWGTEVWLDYFTDQSSGPATGELVLCSSQDIKTVIPVSAGGEKG